MAGSSWPGLQPGHASPGSKANENELSKYNSVIQFIAELRFKSNGQKDRFGPAGRAIGPHFQRNARLCFAREYVVSEV